MQYKKYRIIYTFNDRVRGFNNSITVVALNVDDALEDAKLIVGEVFDKKMTKKFSFKPDPVESGVAL